MMFFHTSNRYFLRNASIGFPSEITVFISRYSLLSSHSFDHYLYQMRVQIFFHQGQKCKIFLPPQKKCLLWGHNTQEVAEYLIYRLVLASAPYAPAESFFHRGQKHTISNFIRGIFPLSPPTASVLYWKNSIGINMYYFSL